MGGKAVFSDLSGRRWGRFWLWSTLIGMLLLAAAIAFIQMLMVTPHLTLLNQAINPERALRALIASEKMRPGIAPPDWLGKSKHSQRNSTHPGDLQVRAAFYLSQDPNSLHSLQENISHISHLITEGFYLGDMPPKLTTALPDSALMEAVDGKELKMLMLVKNLRQGEWQPEAVESLLRDKPEAQRAFAESLAQQLVEGHYAGAVIDWQQVDPVYRDRFTAFIAQLSQVLHQQQIQLWIAVPVGLDIKLLDLDALAAHSDYFLAAIYDENGEDDPPGPPASQPWFDRWIEVLLGYGNPSQWVIGIGSYGYDWPQQGVPATIGFLDSLARAKHQAAGGIRNQAPDYSPHFSYGDPGDEHQVWFLDAITFRNQLELARQYAVAGIAIYRLGTEDPAVYAALNPKLKPEQLVALESPSFFSHIGEGDFLRVEDQHQAGQRSVKVDDDEYWSASYDRLPLLPTVYHAGAGNANEVAITFDDGPDPKWTPKILDILQEKGVKASFFVVGTQAGLYPELVKRMVDEGHEVGVHTYTHPNLSLITHKRLTLELNATQHLLEGIMGRSTVLFRPPYNVDSQPIDISEVAPLLRVQELGYVTVTQSIDTTDWDRPGVDNILQRVKEGRGGTQPGNVILMHDSGGDRRQTIEALPVLIDYLQRRGDHIVSLAHLVGDSRDGFMAPVAVERENWATRTGFDLIRFLERFFWAFMILATLLVLLRTLVVLWLALRHEAALRRNPVPALSEFPPVSLLIAAYNESKVISATLRSVLNTHYPGPVEVVVVDDGSRDDTAELVAALAVTDDRVRLLRQANQGKAKALQTALEASQHEAIVMLDADTQFRRDTIGQMLRFLFLPGVGAVSGHVKVGNRRTWLARFQSLEYTCGFNLDRRAYDQWDCITVVPGAACAMRRSAILASGGISDDTLAEDTDLTLALHRAGYQIRYNPEAIVWTEAPETVLALAKQRVRWSFGTLQCLWKYRDMAFNPRYGALGLFSLPSIALFQMFLVAMIPLVDLLLILSLLWGFGLAIVDYALVFLLVDLLLAVLACGMERESIWQSAYILLMRLIYRPLLAYAVWSSIFRILRGRWGGWGKLERHGNVVVAQESNT